MHTRRTPIEHAAQSFVREHNIKFLKRALKAEADPDDRRVIRRLLREQERIYASASRDIGLRQGCSQRG